MTNDELLQRLYDISCPDLRVRARPIDATAAEVLLYWQACGITYERDGYSIIEDQFYDGMAAWLSSRSSRADLAAGTAIDWESYPPEAFELAEKLKAAKLNRDGVDACPVCWSWSRTCTCEG